jgi:hypothetical protein
VPYVHCPTCRLTAYSGAGYLVREECPRCGSALTSGPRALFAHRSGPVARPPVPGAVSSSRPVPAARPPAAGNG